MAHFQFSVSRKGQDAVACVAQVPGAADIAKFPGGEVVVKTPKGEVKVSLSSAADLILGQLTIELQNGVRDFLFPVAAEQSNGGKRRKSGYTS